MPMKAHCDGCDIVINSGEKQYQTYDAVVPVGPAKHVKFPIHISLGMAQGRIFCHECFLDALQTVLVSAGVDSSAPNALPPKE